MSNGLKLAISIAIPLIIGFTSGFFTATGVGTWYQTIIKPSWNPPNWIFGPVWTALYILMGVALYLVWKQPDPQTQKTTAIIFFAVQLMLNFFWSFIFFKQHAIGGALIEIIVLWVFILITIFSFASIQTCCMVASAIH